MAGEVKKAGPLVQTSIEKKVEVVERGSPDSPARWGIEITTPGATFDLSAMRDKFTQVYFKTGSGNVYSLDDKGVMISANASRKKGEISALKLHMKDLDKEALIVGKQFTYKGEDWEGRAIVGHTEVVTEIVPIYYRSVDSSDVSAFTNGEKTAIVQDFAAQANDGLMHLVESRLEGHTAAPHRHLLHMLRPSEDFSAVASELKGVSVTLKGGEIHVKLDAKEAVAAEIRLDGNSQRMEPDKEYSLGLEKPASITMGDNTLIVTFKGPIQVSRQRPGQRANSRETSGEVLDRFIVYAETDIHDRNKTAELSFIRSVSQNIDVGDSPLTALIQGEKLILVTRMENNGFNNGSRLERMIHVTVHNRDSDIDKAVLKHFEDIAGFDALPEAIRTAAVANAAGYGGKLTITKYERASFGPDFRANRQNTFVINGSFKRIVLNEKEEIPGIPQEVKMPIGGFVNYIRTQFENRKSIPDKTVGNLYSQETDVKNVTYEGTKELGAYVAALVDYLNWFRDNKQGADVVAGLSLGGGVVGYDHNIPVVGFTPTEPYRGPYVDLSTGNVKMEKRK